MNYFILDTDHISLYRQNHEHIRTCIANRPPETIAVTIISYEEQVRGWFAQIHKAKKRSNLIWAYEQLLSTFKFYQTVFVLPFDEKADIQFENLRKTYRRIGTYDLRIAAIAMTINGIVVTRNSRDFGQISGLQVEDWSVEPQ